MPLTTISPETLAHLHALTEEERTYQRDIQRARAYHAGEQFVKLTDRLREFLKDTEVDDYDVLRLNVCRIVVNAILERLQVSGFTTNEQPAVITETDLAGNVVTKTTKPIAEWAWNVWQRNRMDVHQDTVHEDAIRDGESFVLVDWDSIEQRPRFTPHPRYIDATLGGDAFGMKVFYQNDDPNQPMMYATKRWSEITIINGTRRTRQRVTIYYPDRVEKYTEPGMTPVQDEGDPSWPLPWTNPQTGLPLGIPVAHFRNHGGRSEAWEAIPLQNAINKSLVDLMAASDLTAFRVLIALGWKPVDEDGNPLEIEPGVWQGTTNPDGKVEVVDGADLSNLLNVIDSLIFKVAMVTDTPVSRFVTTKQIAAEGTQKQQEGPLLGKIRKRHSRFGNGWEDALIIARRLHNAFSIEPALDETVLINTEWEPAETRDNMEELQKAEAKQRLGIPQEEIWAELGYPQDKIASWKVQAEQRRQEAMEQQRLQAAARPAPFSGQEQ